MNYEQRIIELVRSDGLRMRALRAVQAVDLPDWLIAAGFVRNLIWENRFNKTGSTYDIDVIYFHPSDLSKELDIALEKNLRELEPDFPWSVKNQARMHLKHGDEPYRNTLDAMRFWPEKQTAVGVMLNAAGDIVVRHCFDLSLQFSATIDRNPARSVDVFNRRVSSKGWLKTWPTLQVKT